MMIKRTIDKIFNDRKYFAATLIIIFSLSILAFYLSTEKEIESPIQSFTEPDQVLSVAWSPDGSKLASGKWDQTIKIWDASLGNEISTFQGHEHSVYSVAWSPDGKKLASGSRDESIKIWDVSSGNAIMTLVGHQAGVLSVSWSPDGNKLASGSGDSTIRIWDVLSGNVIMSLVGHQDGVFSVVWSPDGTKLASGSRDHTIKIWDASLGNVINTLVGHDDYVRSVAWSLDGSKLASGSWDQTVKIWDVLSGNVIINLYGSTSRVKSVAWSPDGTKLAAAGGVINIWDVSSGNVISTFDRSNGLTINLESVAWSPDGTKLASASSQEINIWDMSSAKDESSTDKFLTSNKNIFRNTSYILGALVMILLLLYYNIHYDLLSKFVVTEHINRGSTREVTREKQIYLFYTSLITIIISLLLPTIGGRFTINRSDGIFIEDMFIFDILIVVISIILVVFAIKSVSRDESSFTFITLLPFLCLMHYLMVQNFIDTGNNEFFPGYLSKHGRRGNYTISYGPLLFLIAILLIYIGEFNILISKNIDSIQERIIISKKTWFLTRLAFLGMPFLAIVTGLALGFTIAPGLAPFLFAFFVTLIVSSHIPTRILILYVRESPIIQKRSLDKLKYVLPIIFLISWWIIGHSLWLLWFTPFGD